LAPGTSAKASGPALFRRGQSNTHALSRRDSCSGGTAAADGVFVWKTRKAPIRPERKPKARNQDLHQLDRPVGPNQFGGILCVRKNVAVHQRTLIRVESSDVYEAGRDAARSLAGHRRATDADVAATRRCVRRRRGRTEPAHEPTQRRLRRVGWVPLGNEIAWLETWFDRRETNSTAVRIRSRCAQATLDTLRPNESQFGLSGRSVVRAVRKQPLTIALLSLAHFDYERAGVSQFVSQFVSHFRLSLRPSCKPSGRPRYIGESDPRSNPVELSVNTRWLDTGRSASRGERAKASITENDFRVVVKRERLVNST
jgi:hypothetical protein